MRIIKDKLVKQLSKKHGIDPRVVRLIADYPIKFFKHIAGNDTDLRPVRIRYLGVFIPKKSYENEVMELQ